MKPGDRILSMLSASSCHGSFLSSARRQYFYRFVIIGYLLTIAAVSGSTRDSIIVRIRKVDGSIERVSVPTQEGASQSTTQLSDILLSRIPSIEKYKEEEADDNISFKVDSQEKSFCIKDTYQPIKNFQLRNGSLITIHQSRQQQTSETASSTKTKEDYPNRWSTFIPFPAIAKTTSYASVARRSKALSRLPSKRGMSYSDLSKLRECMHTVEPQSIGPIHRIYMCHACAQRFKDSTTTIVSSKAKKSTKSQASSVGQIENKCAILFGTLHKERVDLNKKRPSRTSLSTPLEEVKMCTVAKVQALWDIPSSTSKIGKKSRGYDMKSLWSGSEKNEDQDPSLFISKGKHQRVFEIAESLGLRPIGWIYTYSDNRSGEDNPETDEDPLPVHGRDVINGAKGQIGTMQYLGSDEGGKYVTLAMDANTGATEAFQLSDISVQMVAEGVLTDHDDLNEAMGRFVKTSDPILIDSKETHDLDSVLCLVNTAMVSHSGKFSGVEGMNAVKKNGEMLTPKYKRYLLKALNKENDGDAIRLLSSLNVLLVLDKTFDRDTMDDLCKVLTKYAKGQRKGATLGQKVKKAIRSLLEG